MSRTASIIALLALHLSLLFGGCAEESPDKSAAETGFYQEYSEKKYSDLNASLDGALRPVFSALGNYGEMLEYFQRDRNPEKYEAYRQFVVQAFFDAMHGDVVEAVFANALIENTPPAVLLAIVAPEIGPQGKLQGILDGRHSDVAKHIQRQPQRGYIGSPNFIEYVRYLNGARDKDITSQANSDTIIDHMFKTDPQEAFVSILWADFGFNPHIIGNQNIRREDVPAVRELQESHIAISEYIARIRYSFSVREGQAASVGAELVRLTEHERWWVRLYVARLIAEEPRLRTPGLVERLEKDENENVREAMRELAAEKARKVRGVFPPPVEVPRAQ